MPFETDGFVSPEIAQFRHASELLIPSEPGSTMRSVLIELASICSDTQIHSRLTGCCVVLDFDHAWELPLWCCHEFWCKELTAFCFAVCDRSPVLMDSHDRCIDDLHRSIMSGGSASPIWSQRRA